jgi:hypothetical protein
MEGKLALVFNGHIFLGVLCPLSYCSACREEVCSWDVGGGERPETVRPHHPLQSVLLSNHGCIFGYLAPEWLRVNETKPLVLGAKIIIIIIIIIIINNKLNKNKRAELVGHCINDGGIGERVPNRLLHPP